MKAINFFLKLIFAQHYDVVYSMQKKGIINLTDFLLIT